MPSVTPATKPDLHHGRPPSVARGSSLPLAWDGDHLVVTTAEGLAKVARERLSASTAKSISSCPARLVADKVLQGTVDPFGAAPIGTSGHRVFELLYELPAPQRTRQRMEEFTQQVLRESAPSMLSSGWPGIDSSRHDEWLAEVRSKTQNIFDMEDPQAVQVRRNEWSIDYVDVEGVPFIGFIDRTDITGNGRQWGSKVLDYKGLDVATPIPTPTGWSTMGDLQVGDQVFGSTGRPTQVTLKSDVSHRPCYEITMSDGSTVICDNVHLWPVTLWSEHRGSPVVLDADSLFAAFNQLDPGNPGKKILIRNPSSITMPVAKLASTAYMVGFLATQSPAAPLPPELLRASDAQRRLALSGVMDGVGVYDEFTGEACVSAVHPQLVDSVTELLRTLGIAPVRSRQLVGKRTAHTVAFRPILFNPFTSSLAKNVSVLSPGARQITSYREIVGIKSVDSVPTQCISVDTADSLYVCGDGWVLTHNTGKMKSERKVQKYGDDHGDQLRLYAAAVQASDGFMPLGAAVYYTGTGIIRDVDISEPAMRKTLDKYAQSWVELNAAVSKSAFQAKSGALCGWCSLVNSCPVAARDDKGPRVEGLPLAIDLGIPTIRLLADAFTVTADPVAFDPYESDARIYTDGAGGSVTAESYPGTIHQMSTELETNMPNIISEGQPNFEVAAGQEGLNGSSYAAIAAFDLAGQATRSLTEARIPINANNLDGLAQTYATIIRDVQVSMSGRVSFQDGLHSKLRYVLAQHLRQSPPPLGGDEDDWSLWVSKSTLRIRGVAQSAVRLWTSSAGAFTEAPYLALVGVIAAEPAPNPAAAAVAAAADAETISIEADSPAAATVAQVDESAESDSESQTNGDDFDIA